MIGELIKPLLEWTGLGLIPFLILAGIVIIAILIAKKG